jgi:nitrogen-specific signal transduction histidine kinase/CheY-like chemotaxis protein
VKGAPSGLVGLSLDVTERQQAEAERRKLQAKLLEVQKLESLGLMAGGIAHDFNNILTVILGNASNALYSLPDDSPVRQDIEAAMAAAQRAADLTRQMLAYSGRARFEVKPLDLSHQVREIAALVATTMPGKVQLRLELAELPAVLADGAQLQQVIMNLVLNAAEAIGDGAGHVSLATECRSIGPDEARTLSPDEPLAPGRYVFLRVSDTGCGMDADTVTKIFDPFFTTKFTGRGLGLAAVLGIIRAHKGAILVDSTPGKGSTFTVVIPSTEQRAEREQRSADRYLGNGLALLVDDDATVRLTVRKMLATSGFTVIEAADGRHAVRAVAEHGAELALIVLDLTMPEMDGAEALRAIRERSDVPVILMSGYSELEATRRLATSRFQAFLQKPFSSEQLASKLRLVLQRHTLPPRASSGNADERTA